MNINDFTLTRSEAARLREIDALVAEGLSRARATKLVGQLDDLINGPWLDLLTPLANPSDNHDPERGLLQSFFIAYVNQWSNERMLIAALVQQSNLAYLAEQDQNTKEA